MKEILQKLTNNYILTQQEAKDTLVEIANGAYNESQMAAFMTVYLMRSIRTHELAGFKEAMLELCKSIDLSGYGAMDMCGTGGDGKDTFNISTTSCFVVAGAGQNIAKHGNNGVSSMCGSSNLLVHLGYEFKAEESELRKSLDEAGICFLHAPLFHPAMKNVAPVRRDLSLKTFFNMLGPQVNPSRPEKQLIGVYNLELARLYQYLHQNENRDCAIVHALDGYDEISLTGAFKVITNQAETVYYPEDLGLNPVTQESINGGHTVEDSAQIFLNVLKGEATEAQTEVVLANAGLALTVGQGLKDIKEGVALAKESIASGAAYQSFKTFLNPNKTQIPVS
ncbi:anthranilate phosphoribosyltransferase [Reichenbachiella faecimaris]|uniref:Anthranilate phosphoribosyltransferase n=1 Tax=Reichenbachiella faecimaris TaxID=692418 RepID=A0A1W2G4P7_REIFA|nr:anthranilate phosphoribosyltransferase [Reichenbachiella faecimaris]SMD31645.1 anthranilate phosphoribosyltransferase [Reichenbachiella faecimaris]